MEYIGEIKNGVISILHIATGFKFTSWEDAIKHELMCEQLKEIVNS